jgi:hypothetical protein
VVGLLPWQSAKSNSVRYEYDANKDFLEIKDKSKSIKIVSEDISKDAEFVEAKNYIREASAVYFLGLNYLSANFERISPGNTPKVNYVGTGHDLSPHEKITHEINMEKYFNNKIEILKDHKIIDLIRARW